jgi:hypothetical protein
MSYFSRKVKRAYRFYKAKAGCWLHGRGLAYAEGALSATITRANGETEDLGVICRNEVTDTGVAFIVDAFQNSTELETMKYHGCGTDNTAEDQTDTALGAEVETRGTGTTTEGATANIYKTVGTVNITATRAIVEHGVFSASTSGVLLDRSVFSVINVDNGDSIEFTYELTLTAGG